MTESWIYLQSIRVLSLFIKYFYPLDIVAFLTEWVQKFPRHDLKYS